MSEPHPHRLPRVLRVAFKILLPLLILAVAVAGGVQMMSTAPKAKRQAPPPLARLVEVETVPVDAMVAEVEAMGEVVAARSVDLQPRVSGQVDWVSPDFLPGGLFAKGDRIVGLDATDLRLVLTQREAALAEAKSDLAIEQGQQVIARQEFELLGAKMGDDETALVLRQPQLAAARAAVTTAESQVRQARLDVRRTGIAAPFDAVIERREVDLGAQVTTATTVATLIGTDAFWVRAELPVDRLGWIDIPRRDGEAGARVRVYNEAAWGSGVYRVGRVVRLETALESQGRMARLLIAVDDPMALRPETAGAPVLLIGTYVRTVIEGMRVGPGPLVDRRLLRDNDTVWVMTDRNALEIRPVALAFRGRERVLIGDGLSGGERLVKTDLAIPVDGMALRVRDADADAGGGS